MTDRHYDSLRDAIGMAWTGTPGGPGNKNSVDAVVEAIPDGWAKVGGRWVRIEQHQIFGWGVPEGGLFRLTPRYRQTDTSGQPEAPADRPVGPDTP